MANPNVAAETCVAVGATGHQFESYPGRDVALGALTVTRVLFRAAPRRAEPRHVCESEPCQLRRGVEGESSGDMTAAFYDFAIEAA